jgi:ribosomal protein S18 acetylase RimI-like enzyme
MRFFRPVPRISLAGQDDAAALADLLVRCGEQVTPADVESWFRGGFEVYKAVFEDRLVGMVRCAFPTGACVIDALVVDPGYRRRGFGQYLAEHAVSRARRSGAPKAWMQLPAGSEEALRMLHKLGFRESARLSRTQQELLLVELHL